MKEKRKRKGEFILNIRKKKIGGSIRGDVIKRVSDNAVYKARNDSRNIKVWEGAGVQRGRAFSLSGRDCRYLCC